MIGTILTGYLVTFITPKYVLMGIYGLRGVLIVIVVFIPTSITTVMIFSVFFGVSLMASKSIIHVCLLNFLLIVSLVIDRAPNHQICW